MKKFKNQSPKGPNFKRPPGASKSQRSEIHRETTVPKHWRVIAGNHSVIELLKVRPKSVPQLWLKEGYESNSDLRGLDELARKSQVHVLVKPESHLHKIYPNHQGCLAFAESRAKIQEEVLLQKKYSTLVALDGVEDPHNLGAILRTTWLIGVDGVLAPEDRAVGLSPTVHKVACGGVEHVPFLESTAFHPKIQDLKKMGYWIFGLSHKAKKSLYDVRIPEKIVWVLGSEEKGLRTTTEKICDELVSIPQSSISASYNVSVSAAFALSETQRQRLKSH